MQVGVDPNYDCLSTMHIMHSYRTLKALKAFGSEKVITTIRCTYGA